METNSKPTYKRQRFLLSFIQQITEGVTPTDLQKLVFLYTMQKQSGFYEFVPYKFGPYSFQLAEDIDILRRDGYLNNNSSCIQTVLENQSEFTFPIATERGDNLISKAYREHPYYAINSEIIGRLFKGDEAKWFNQGRKRYKQKRRVLFTIGYEGKSVEAFMNSLIMNDVRILCDVRKNPLSRKFGFSKGKLSHIAETIGIKYVHIPDLGIESDKRSSLKTAEDYRQLFSKYAKTLQSLTPYLDHLHLLLQENDRIALMCFEKDSVMCHRNVIRNHLIDTYTVESEDL